MKLKILSITILVVVTTWQIYGKYQGMKEEQQDALSNYTSVPATIKRVTPSGVRNRRSTILMVSYKWDDNNKQTTIRRGGYTENKYNVGDTITIYVNPSDPADIK